MKNFRQWIKPLLEELEATSTHEIMMLFFNWGKKDARKNVPPRAKEIASWYNMDYDDWMGRVYDQGYHDS